MQFVSIYDKRPLRLLRQVGSVTDDGLAEFLQTERRFKLRQALKGARWVDIYDIRSFEGLSSSQREALLSFVQTNLPCIAESTVGVAFVVPPALEVDPRALTEPAGRQGISTHVGQSLDAALEWALELAFDEVPVLDADLVLGGIDAFRLVIQ